MAFSFDTTLGLALTIALHRAALAGARRFGARRAASGHALAPSAAQDKAGTPAPPGGDAAAGGAACWEVLQACGDYGEPPSVRRWALQAAEWVACVVAARVLCGTLVVLLGGALAHVALVRWSGVCARLRATHAPACACARTRAPLCVWPEGGGRSRCYPPAPSSHPARLHRRAWTACSGGTPRCCCML